MKLYFNHKLKETKTLKNGAQVNMQGRLKETAVKREQSESAQQLFAYSA